MISGDFGWSVSVLVLGSDQNRDSGDEVEFVKFAWRRLSFFSPLKKITKEKRKDNQKEEKKKQCLGRLPLLPGSVGSLNYSSPRGRWHCYRLWNSWVHERQVMLPFQLGTDLDVGLYT